MNVGDAVDAIVGILVDNVDTINANTKLVASGYTLKTDAGIASNDTSQYRYIKRGDRAILPKGLTLCVVPVSSTEIGYLAPNVSERLAKVEIIAYITGGDIASVDWDIVQTARMGIGDALRELFNDADNRTLTFGEVSFYDCRINNEEYRYYERIVGDQGIVSFGVSLKWSGRYYVEEGVCDG